MSADSHNCRHDVLGVLGELSLENNEKSNLHAVSLPFLPIEVDDLAKYPIWIPVMFNMRMRSKQTKI